MNFSTMSSMIVKELSSKLGEQVNPAMSIEMANQIDLWQRMYSDQNNKAKNTVGIPAAIASEIARLTTLEMKVSVTGSDLADRMQKSIDNLRKTIRVKAEVGCALGGMVIKPYFNGDEIKTEFIPANDFYPIGFSGDELTECVFIEQLFHGKFILTRMEVHWLKGTTLNVYNWAYQSTISSTLGTEIKLSSVPEWEGLSDFVTIHNVKKLPFGYFKVPMANQEQNESPIGVSVYAKAVKQIEIANQRYGQVNWEFEAKEAAVHISEDALKMNPETDKPEVPKGKERLYRVVQFHTGATDKPFLDVFSPEIRDESMYNGLNRQLRLIEFNSNLAYGTLSDPNNTDKTATEINASKQRSYQFISDVQIALEDAIRDYLEAIRFYADLYGFGGDYDVQFYWDDSMITDANTEQLLDMQKVQLGVMPKFRFIMKWEGVDEKTAKQWLQEVKEENKSDPEELNPFGFRTSKEDEGDE